MTLILRSASVTRLVLWARGLACSRADRDFEMAGWDTESASAAADPLPVTATVRKTTS